MRRISMLVTLVALCLASQSAFAQSKPELIPFPGRTKGALSFTTAPVAFADLRGAQTAWTADRTEFLGLGGGLDYFLRTVFNYPTLAECYKVAALDASNKLRF